MKPRIVVVGSSNTDMIIKIQKLPKPGETVLGGSFSLAAGGKGANQAVAAARAGADVVFVARVGNDSFGNEAIRGLVGDGIGTDFVTVDQHLPSGIAFILIDAKGENSIAVASGANAAFAADDIVKARSLISSANVLLVQLEVPLEAVRTAVELAAAANVPVVLNPAPAQPLDDALLKMISVITPNETEAEMLTAMKTDRDESIRKAADVLLSRGVHSVIITLGSRGAYVADSRGKEFVRAFAVDAVDTTAAGDIFNGALAVSLAEGNSLRNAAHFASAAAALSVTKLGAQPSAPYRREIEALLPN